MKPLIVVNFKTYKQGRKAVELARKLSKVGGKNIILAVQANDVFEIKKAVKDKKIKLYVQHVDYEEPGRATGHILPESVKADGAKGSLLNHSEHKLNPGILKKTIKRCRETGLETIVCVASIKNLKKVLRLNPSALAFEVPELISIGRAISKEKPESVRKFAEIIKRHNQKSKRKIIALCGAGISKPEDVKEALKLGCAGVLVSSAVVKSKTPEKLVREMLG